MIAHALYAHAERIDRSGAAAACLRMEQSYGDDPERHAIATLLATAYPALAPQIESGTASLPDGPAPDPAGTKGALDALRHTADEADFRSGLRRIALAERWRIALREALPAALGGADVDATAAQLSALADDTITAALDDASRRTFAALGRPMRHDGRPSALTVLGMGKLGGHELNAGSDVDLVCFYDSDDGAAQRDDGRPTNATIHTVWTKVVQQMTAHLEAVTELGFVWRVDHRLRPEGAQGALVNSLAAAERYYETFGRLWERAAMSRARCVAGSTTLGAQVIAMLEPFVWQRRVDPSIANTMYDLVHRTRRELSHDRERDLKLCPGGIREAEFVVQTLQLIWGGRHPRVRSASTIDAARRLRTSGLMTEREARELVAAYLALRRSEHAIQLATGVQTHSVPRQATDAKRVARMLGFDDADRWLAHLRQHTDTVSAMFRSLLPEDAPRTTRWEKATQSLDRTDLPAFECALEDAGMPWAQPALGGELARDLFEMARQPNSPLGSRSREKWRSLGPTLLDAIADAADPVQAARYLRGFAARVRPASVYSKLLAEDANAVRRLVTALGGSAFVGEAVAIRPELADVVLFHARIPSRAEAHHEVRQGAELLCVSPDDNVVEEQAGALRRAKSRLQLEVALADLGGDLDTTEVTRVLSALADEVLEQATAFALNVPIGEPVRGLCVLAMGKLGGQEIGYGSDLDVIFLYDAQRAAAAAQSDPVRYFSRCAQQVIQLITMPHAEGPGYELDTRLRPSGNQGLLVVSLEAFGRYHELTNEQRPGGHAATWERVALLRARFAAGDAEIGEAALRIAHRAAYERSGELDALAADMRHLRQRMERELANERADRYDLKFGRGGLLDVEFCTQLLQLEHGAANPDVRTTETRAALTALAKARVLSTWDADALLEGYAFLRKLEQRLRIVHGDSSHLIEAKAAGLEPLARRMGIRELPGMTASQLLLERYRRITGRIRTSYERIVGVH